MSNVPSPLKSKASEFDIVVTCADHGELLGEHDLWGHGFGLYPELLRVPLVVSGVASLTLLLVPT